jgi:hypothetical protein
MATDGVIGTDRKGAFIDTSYAQSDAPETDRTSFGTHIGEGDKGVGPVVVSAFSAFS